MASPRSWLEPAVVAGSLAPFVLLGARALGGTLGADPVAELLNQLGLLTLVFLVASLACTPLKILLGWKWPIAVRRTLGLFAFFTACAHFLVYLVLDRELALGAVVADVTERPFVTVGFAALVVLVPLAVTSTKRALQRLGPRRWRWLHRLAYVAGVLGVVHYFIRVKKDTTEPLVYGAVLALLFAVRIGDAVHKQLRRSAARRRTLS
ncbi:MAG: sulfoxide reductase heme-binding subunit YedZ [Polyangiaceae bacterium]|nr:sulfoxide reductase heme-binding subunit YedZ [Polyangiaceae bacterium]